MFEHVKAIIKRYINRDDLEITQDTDVLTDLGLNSLELVELACTFEMEFGIEIPEKDIRGFLTVNDIVNYIELAQAA